LEFKNFLDDDINLYFTNNCQSSQNYVCNYIKGWNIKNEGIYSGTHNHTNLNINLKRNITIIQQEGKIEFSFKLNDNMDTNEYLTIGINQNIVSK